MSKSLFILFAFFLNLDLKDTLKAFGDLKNKHKSVSSNAFWYVKVCIFWKFIQYTTHWDETQMIEKISFGLNERFKNELSFFASSKSS